MEFQGRTITTIAAINQSHYLTDTPCMHIYVYILRNTEF